MYAMARELGAALTTGQIIEIGIRHVCEGFHVRASILLPDSAEKVRQKVEETRMSSTWMSGNGPTTSKNLPDAAPIHCPPLACCTYR
jgi:K+-sensing histidine kinase KdpD